MAAEKKVNDTHSLEPLIALQQRYSNATELASLDISIGVNYSQITGVVNFTNAALYFTKALDYENLPDQTLLQVLEWHGNSLEQIGKVDEALKDYLRGLLGCSYYDLSGGWPEILMPKVGLSAKVGISINSPDPENSQRLKDYNHYRRCLDFQQFLLMKRYYFIDAVKRVRQGKSDHDLIGILENLWADSVRIQKIIDALKAENKRPWP